jgi:hypothetical protein
MQQLTKEYYLCLEYVKNELPMIMRQTERRKLKILEE